MSQKKIKRKQPRIKFTPHIEKRVEVPRPAHSGVVWVDEVEYGITVRDGGVVLTARPNNGASSNNDESGTAHNTPLEETSSTSNQVTRPAPIAIVMDTAEAKAVGRYLLEASKLASRMRGTRNG